MSQLLAASGAVFIKGHPIDTSFIVVYCVDNSTAHKSFGFNRSMICTEFITGVRRMFLPILINLSKLQTDLCPRERPSEH